MPVSRETIDGDNADIYFHRTQELLRREGLDPVATMEVFAGSDGVLCGVAEVVALLNAAAKRPLEIWALAEGAPMAKKEVVLRIRGFYRDYGLYETALLGVLASESGWATAAHAIVEAAQPTPVISFGARHVHPDTSARMEYASIIGGCVTGATPAGARLAGKEASGTMPHALILIMGDTLKAAEAFDKWMPQSVNRVALVDTFRDEAEEAVRVAGAMDGRLWGVRLDTPAERGRVTPDLVKEVRAKLDLAGFPQIRIFVSGGIDLERIRLFKTEHTPVDGYGIGSAISSAPPIDFTGDLKEIDGKPVAKRGRIPGLTDTPRLNKIQ